MAQTPTVGLRQFDPSTAFDGYVLFSPEDNEFVYLINHCGGVVKKWTFRDRPNRTSYFLENGSVLRIGKQYLEIRSWEDELIWSYDVVANDFQQHHDIEPLPNGNILCIIYDDYTREEAIAFGRNPAKITEEGFRLDKIIEVKPVGSNGLEVVWEWKLADHLIQDLDHQRPNFGVVSDHPELLDVNFDNEEVFNYVHMNAIDYNAELDQIVFSLRNLSEVYIIDHSTTTEEAAGHSGGNSGKGGDFLWRWGNPQVYQSGTPEDRQLIRQHNPEWVKKGYADEGKLTLFNNRTLREDAGESSVELLDIPSSDGSYLLENGVFLPVAPVWSWKGDILGTTMYERTKSGINAMPDGSFLVCESNIGQISRISQSGTVLWTYKNPDGLLPNIQFEEPVSNDIFRGEYYPVNYPAFEGRSLVSQGIIENENPVAVACGERDSNQPIPLQLNHAVVKVINPVINQYLQILDKTTRGSTKRLISMDGRTIDLSPEQWHGFSPLQLPKGIYFMQIEGPSQMEAIRLIIR